MKCFRSGTRRNNSEFMLCGRQIAVPLFFIKRHTIYQSLVCNDMAYRLTSPESVKEYMEKHETFSMTGDFFRAEGGDYVTENVNRSIKNQLPPRVPTVQNWVTASSCFSRLEKIRTSVFERSGMNEPCSERSAINVSNETQMFRREIRQSGWIENPDEKRSLSSIDSKCQLHHNLLNVVHDSRENYRRFLQEGKPAELLPIFITYQDETDYNDEKNWTVSKLKNQILTTINQLQDQDLATFYLNHYKKNVSNSNKEAHVNLYIEVKNVLLGNDSTELCDD